MWNMFKGVMAGSARNVCGCARIGTRLLKGRGVGGTWCMCMYEIWVRGSVKCICQL